jgi:hypothetical protein
MAEFDLRTEQSKVVRNALLAAVFCAAVLASTYFGLPMLFSFPTDLAGRLAFALQADILVLLWLALAVRMVSRVRFVSAADNRGAAYAPPSAKLAVKAAFLQNTLEQSVLAIGAHLVLATLIEGPTLALLVGAVALFVIGRASFLASYSNGAGARAFGMVVTSLPSMAACLWALWLIGAALIAEIAA